jgi:ABC-type Fe3+ transport system permease subunit
MDNYDWRGIDLSFGAAFGMAVVALLGVTPLAWVVRHRYWVGRSAGSE